MATTRDYLQAERDGWATLGAPTAMQDWLLAHGQEYAIGPETFAGPRGEVKQCYMNSALLAFRRDDLVYVEGKIETMGMLIDHAWCVDRNGIVIEPTLDGDNRDDFSRIHGYFGVPFLTRYVRKAVLQNGLYGLLDGYGSRRTLPKLIELGLQGGQQWLLAQTKRVPDPARRRKKRTC